MGFTVWLLYSPNKNRKIIIPLSPELDRHPVNLGTAVIKPAHDSHLFYLQDDNVVVIDLHQFHAHEFRFFLFFLFSSFF